ncbi:unnamed protein product [Boreogadus saida]
MFQQWHMVSLSLTSFITPSPVGFPGAQSAMTFSLHTLQPVQLSVGGEKEKRAQDRNQNIMTYSEIPTERTPNHTPEHPA